MGLYLPTEYAEAPRKREREFWPLLGQKIGY